MPLLRPTVKVGWLKHSMPRPPEPTTPDVYAQRMPRPKKIAGVTCKPTQPRERPPKHVLALYVPIAGPKKMPRKGKTLPEAVDPEATTVDQEATTLPEAVDPGPETTIIVLDSEEETTMPEAVNPEATTTTVPEAKTTTVPEETTGPAAPPSPSPTSPPSTPKGFDPDEFVKLVAQAEVEDDDFDPDEFVKYFDEALRYEVEVERKPPRPGAYVLHHHEDGVEYAEAEESSSASEETESEVEESLTFLDIIEKGLIDPADI